MTMQFRCASIALATFLLAIGSTVGAEEESKKLRDLFDRAWEFQLKESPTLASALGDRRYNDRWADASLQAIERRHRQSQSFLEELSKIDPAGLTAEDRVNYQIFGRQLRERIDGHRFRRYLVPLNQRGGVQALDQFSDQLRFKTERDYTDWIARLKGIPALVDQTLELMREGVRFGMVHPKIVMQRIPQQISAQIVADPSASPFFKPFLELPASIATARQHELSARAQKAISEGVVPAYKKMLEFVEKEYLPACYDRAGVWQATNGKDYYSYAARTFTTTELTPKQIHEIGLTEVARIRGQMQRVIREASFDGTFDEFLQFLRTDPQFYYEKAEDLLDAYRAFSKRIDPELVKLFGRLPRIPYGVRPIPDVIAPDTTTAYYQRPAADGSRAGTYFVNLYKPEVRPKYEIEALSLHEAVPGHHLQIALAMELGNLPRFRRFSGFTAFVEGWALYGESLGEEMGFYADPYSKFGQLTYEMWRAVRLVVDTGMHFFGWTRQRAIDFFKANAAKTETDIVNEIDRYIAWPGQALAYKIGELKIKELRRLAEKELGESFDIRAFHDTVLGSGAIPLDLLEANVKSWISTARGDSAR